MNRFNIRWKRYFHFLTRTLMIITVLGVVACSSSSRTPQTTATDDSSIPDFDTDLSDTTFDNSSNLPNIDDLFENNTSSDPLPEQDFPDVPAEQVDPNEFSCLASDASFGFGGSQFPGTGTTFGGGTGSTFDPQLGGASFMIDPLTGMQTNAGAQSLSCLDPGFGNGMNPFLGAGIQSFGLMNICVQIAASRPPRQGASQQEAAYAFAQAQLAMIRCFREINWQQQSLFQTQRVVRWAPPIVASFRRTDHNLWTLLSILSTGVNTQHTVNGY